MFGRGNWAIIGIRKSTEDAFIEGLDNFASVSQASAVEKAKKDEVPTSGINPFQYPRFDESRLELDVTGAEFKLGDGVYGLWFCQNSFKDVTDAPSKREQAAYDEVGKPFKFCNKDEKKGIEDQVKVTAVVERKQFPVLVDFVNERVYAATATEADVEAVIELLQELGAETFALAWQFGDSQWVNRFLNKVNDETKFESEMEERAEELQRFRKDEIEKSEDKMVESILSTFYALSELETGQWCGLTTPARIRLYAPADPIGTAGASLTFTLLRLSEDSEVAASSVIFQKLDSKIIKKTDEERQFRVDLFTIDLNDNINLLDSGAALLRGFDLPGFRKEIKTATKAQSSPLAIKDYWKMWLEGMSSAVFMFVDNVTETFHIDKKNFGLLPFAADGEKTTRETVEVK